MVSTAVHGMHVGHTLQSGPFVSRISLVSAAKRTHDAPLLLSQPFISIAQTSPNMMHGLHAWPSLQSEHFCLTGWVLTSPRYARSPALCTYTYHSNGSKQGILVVKELAPLACLCDPAGRYLVS